MKIKEVIIKLSCEELLRVRRILVDEDPNEAMLFIKECLKPQIDNATKKH
ncbi:MAG TPA: hypothetical protein PLW88_06785 [Syntrophorhabdaceae bacterium]|nr:hypothetical protein [Syntrophorhabdaceae bacterium]HPP07060.1 hypothetical protein [Syntrophorhabdaceae bacterium]